MSRAEVTFAAAGETLAATLYQPAAAAGRLSCVVMGHGFTLTRRDGLPGYAQRLAHAGFAVLAFDYRHWGDSTGEPRRWVSLRQQLGDWQAAVERARSLESIDPERVAVWGMSMGGGPRAADRRQQPPDRRGGRVGAQYGPARRPASLQDRAADYDRRAPGEDHATPRHDADRRPAGIVCDRRARSAPGLPAPHRRHRLA
ncbi:MAG: alpha/beta hydrolase [Trebonia sp.]